MREERNELESRPRNPVEDVVPLKRVPFGVVEPRSQSGRKIEHRHQFFVYVRSCGEGGRGHESPTRDDSPLSESDCSLVVLLQPLDPLPSSLDVQSSLDLLQILLRQRVLEHELVVCGSLKVGLKNPQEDHSQLSWICAERWSDGLDSIGEVEVKKGEDDLRWETRKDKNKRSKLKSAQPNLGKTGITPDKHGSAAPSANRRKIFKRAAHLERSPSYS